MAKKKRKIHQKKVEKKKVKLTSKRKTPSVGIFNQRHFIVFAILTLSSFLIILYSNSPLFQHFIDSIFVKHSPIEDQKSEHEISEDRIPFPASQSDVNQQEITFDDFVGSKACTECHKEQFEVWSKSTHGLAGGTPNAKTLIGDFTGKKLRFKDAVVTPVTRNGKYKFIVEPKGLPKQIINVDAVVGGGHMIGGGTQSYFSKFPDGTIRFIPFDFIRQENLWFCQVKKSNNWIPINENMSLSDLRQWPPHRILGAENSFSNCQNCHGSQIQVYYDLEKKRYVTKYKSLDINCESCHGPGKRHIEIVKSPNWQGSTDIGMQALFTLSKDHSIKICSQCHATKDVIKNNYFPGKELEHYYSLKFPILGENPYLEDGRVRAFAYQQNHIYSDCYLNGSMTCVDCHDPHSLNYRDIWSNPLEGKFDNDQCLDCHPSKSESPELHSHHKTESPGNLCISCHMPFLQHKLVGTQLKFTRSDHTIPIPRPLFDTQIGIENACQKCHKDKTIGWLQVKTEEWYGSLKPHKDIVAALLKAKNISDRKIAAELLLDDSISHPMAQFAALSYFVKNFLHPDMSYLEPEIIETLKKLSETNDLDLKALALMSLHLACDQNAKVHNYLLTRLQKLGTEELPIRKRWAIAMDYLGTVYGRNGDFENAVAGHKKALEIIPDDAVAYVNLGIAYSNKGNIEDAKNAFRKAIEINPYNASPHLNLGNIFFQLGDFSLAVISYNKALAIKPVDATAHFYLARLYNVRGQKQEAIKALKEGLKYAPNDLTARSILQNLQSE